MASTSSEPQFLEEKKPNHKTGDIEQPREETPPKSSTHSSSQKKSSSWNTDSDSEPEFTPPSSANRFFKTESEPSKFNSGSHSKKKSQKQKDKSTRHNVRRAQKEARAELDRERQQEEAAQARREQRKSTHPYFVSPSADKSEYDELHRARQAFHADPDRNPFPTPKSTGLCTETRCIKADSFVCCHHDLERVLQSSGEFSEAWLKKERLL